LIKESILSKKNEKKKNRTRKEKKEAKVRVSQILK
jgi:hypothetical protein